MLSCVKSMMKKAFILFVSCSLLLASCEKPDNGEIPDSLAGAWKLVVVKDIATNMNFFKPASIQGEVILRFYPESEQGGSFDGNTPTNLFTGFGVWANTYTLGPGRAISIPALSMTKVAETSWGARFVDNITEAVRYNFEPGNKLNIRTTRKVLIFIKE